MIKMKPEPDKSSKQESIKLFDLSLFFSNFSREFMATSTHNAMIHKQFSSVPCFSFLFSASGNKHITFMDAILNSGLPVKMMLVFRDSS